jgi:leucyl aminopeptidase
MAARESGAPPTTSIGFSDQAVTEAAVDALVLTVADVNGDWQGPLAEINDALNGQLQAALQGADFKAKVGSTYSLATLGQLPVRLLIVSGLPESGASAEDVRKAYGVAATAARNAKAKTVACPAPSGIDTTDAYRAAVEGALLALYDFKVYRSAEDELSNVESWSFLAAESPEAAEGVQLGLAMAAGVYLARDLVFEPGNTIFPVSLANVAREMARNQELEYQEFDEVQLAEMGAGALTAVGVGSTNPPRLMHMTYTPSGESRGTIALVGKGITFDTGGMSLKTGEGMVPMKTDMAGSAAVLGAMRAISEMELPFTVYGIVAAAENMPSGTAYRPSDVLTALNGKTIEVISTDAEGRLVLADALVYAARQGAEEMIDLATLTGAKVVALGSESVAVFSNDDQMAADIVAAGDAAGELFWHMPLWEALRPQLNSETADMKNTGGRGGGSITAALFLAEFAEGKKWTHLDIAGAAWTSSTNGYTPKGATGVAVRALVNYLENKAASA